MRRTPAETTPAADASRGMSDSLTDRPRAASARLMNLANLAFCPPAPRKSARTLSRSTINASIGVSPRALYDTFVLTQTAFRSRPSTSPGGPCAVERPQRPPYWIGTPPGGDTIYRSQIKFQVGLIADPFTPRPVYSHLGTGDLATTGGVNEGVNKIARVSARALAEGLSA